MRSANRRSRGFTLIELMMVVAIIGVLAAVAIPAYMKYTRRSRTVEAVMNLRTMYDGAASYYVAEHADSTGGVISKQFPGNAGPTPTLVPGHGPGDVSGVHMPVVAEFSAPEWAALDFFVQDPYRYQYSFTVQAGTKPIAALTAQGDLNGDNFLSTFQRHAIGNGDAITGDPALYSVNELE